MILAAWIMTLFLVFPEDTKALYGAQKIEAANH